MRPNRLVVWVCATWAWTAAATIHYVDANGGKPTPPFTAWATAARVIQDAVDVAVAGDDIVVTNGTYATGGRATYGKMTNRVTVDIAITVRSVNGPSLTVIQGNQLTTTTNGDGAVRCSYLTNGARLFGFTLTNGGTLTNGDYYAAQSGAGIWCEADDVVVSNCVVIGNSAAGDGGGTYRGNLVDCALIGNSALSWRHSGGGAYGSTLKNCALLSNQASLGGGAYGGTLVGCILSNNFAMEGGGAYSGLVSNCTLANNRAGQGGGAAGDFAVGPSATLQNCTLLGNEAGAGGGASEAVLNNCEITGNLAYSFGGGVFASLVNNSTITGNSSGLYGGGAGSEPGPPGGVGPPFCTLRNCIVYFNSAIYGDNYYLSFLDHCCATPLPDGPGNISEDPKLASTSHLSVGSPCRGAGDTNYAGGVDIDGETWLSPPSMGCDEYHPGGAFGPSQISINPGTTNIATGYLADFSARITGAISASAWDFGDGIVVSNQPYAVHAWPIPGDYMARLTAYSDAHPGGIVGTAAVHVVAAPVLYVSSGSPNPEPPYTSWATAATNIQDAVDAATMPGSIVLVTNGAYATGGRAVILTMTNRLVVNKILTVRSVNGPRFTFIVGNQVPVTTNGEGAIRCVYLGNGATLSGFTLTNGAARLAGNVTQESGGGVWCEPFNTTVSNCIIVNCSAPWYGGGAAQGALLNCYLEGNSAGIYGGGAYGSSMTNCALTANVASEGGGAYSCVMNNCTLTGNKAWSGGGGASESTLNNCLIYYNTAPGGSNNAFSTLTYCCTMPASAGPGNISGEPELASPSHISAGSPCRGAGNAGYVTGYDIDGEHWAVPPSIGCDEYQAGPSGIPLAVSIIVSDSSIAVGYPIELRAQIGGEAKSSTWDFGDQTTQSNRPYATHFWSSVGDYQVVLRVENGNQPGGISNTTTVHVVPGIHYVAAGGANPKPPYTSWATASTNIQDAIDLAEPGGQIIVSNGLYSSGARAAVGTLLNRVVVDKPVAVRSLNGASSAVIEGTSRVDTTNGDGAVRCVYLAAGATLTGFTLTNGATLATGNNPDGNGGGVYCESMTAVVSDCIISGNSSYSYGGGSYSGTLQRCVFNGNSAWDGGGAANGVLTRCTLTRNSAFEGGGSFASTLNSCLLTSNSAADTGGGAWGGAVNNGTLVDNLAGAAGGGAFRSTLNNSVVYFNNAATGPNYDSVYSILNYCCTTPQPPSGTGNITNEPALVDHASENLRLQTNSPCINAGFNAYAPGTTDLDDNPRIVGGTVDIGAYEFQHPASVISYAWLEYYGFPIDGTADYTDPDGDGMKNWQEWIAGTNPRNGLSALRLLAPASDGTNVALTWQSVAGVTYSIERNSNVAWTFTPLAAGILGQPGTTTFNDTNVVGSKTLFYRVSVEHP